MSARLSFLSRLLLPLMAVVALASCRPTASPEAEYLDFLYRYLPLPDSAAFSREWYAANVRKTLEVREQMGWNVPEREFRHFVLPTRVNNEDMDDFRLLYADTLCRRVQGLSMYDAILEVNHWCHEQATYRPSDARTSGPLATMAYGYGRCGEESVLGVAALRAAGIPARQVYTPRWAHTDDNHAWIEAWADGTWYFLGACEPEPRLNMAWFNAPASRAMMMHTRVFGDYRGDEDVVERSAIHTEINVIANYVPTRRNTVTVVDEQGTPVAGALVEFKIYNYAEFYTVASYRTDVRGAASLTTGLGDLLVWASRDGRFGFAKADGEQTTVVLSHSVGERFSADIDIVPPTENPIPTDATAADVARNAARLAFEDSLRAARHTTPVNAVILDSFRTRYPGAAAEALLASLTEKDRRDVPFAVLADAMCTDGYAHNGLGVEDVWTLYRDCPRVELEPLKPFRSVIDYTQLPRFRSPAEVLEWVRANVTLVDGRNLQRLRMAPIDVWNARVADDRSRHIFFVALCRALGFQARIDVVTGKTQYLWADADGGTTWVTVSSAAPTADAAAPSVVPRGTLTATYQPSPYIPDPIYYRHFTLSSLDDGRCHLLDFEEGEATEAGTLATWRTLLQPGYRLDAGYYLLTTGNRMADGSVMAHMEFFAVSADALTPVPLVVREPSAEAIAVIGTFNADPLLPYTGRGYYLLAIVGDNDEPSTHLRRQLDAIAPQLTAWGRPQVLFGGDHAALAAELCEGCSQTFLRLPVLVIADSFGRIVYLSQGYNTSVGEEVKRVVSTLTNEKS